MNKNKLGVTLAIITVLLCISAIFTFYAPVISFGFQHNFSLHNHVRAWGTLGSFFTLAFGLNSAFLCNQTYENPTTAIYYLSFRPNIGLIALFVIEILLLIIGAVTIVLILIKKYKRKMKLFLSLVTSALLITAIVLSFYTPLFFDKEVIYEKFIDIFGHIEVPWHRPIFHLGLGSIAYITICSFALFASATNVIINCKENFLIEKK